MNERTCNSAPTLITLALLSLYSISQHTCCYLLPKQLNRDKEYVCLFDEVERERKGGIQKSSLVHA